MWRKQTDTSKIGNYVYGLAIPVYGSTYIIKYVGQASLGNVGRCFQHRAEAKKYLAGHRASNVKKVEMINYYASNGNYEIVILAHQIPDKLLDTMENIYRQMADYGALLFTISQNEIVYEKNLTNIAYTHNNKLTVGTMVVKPMTVKQIDDIYASKIYLSSADIATKLQLSPNKKILYVLNRPGVQANGVIGWWNFGQARLNNTEWIVLVGENDIIQHVYRVSDITFITRQFVSNSGRTVNKKGFNTNGLTNYIYKLTPNNGIPCFDVNNQLGYTYL